MKLKKLISRITETAFIEPVVSSLRLKKGKPGERIERLSEEERELLRTATSKDFQDLREETAKIWFDKSCDWYDEARLKLEKKFNRRKMVG